jgi:hypothetical protein
MKKLLLVIALAAAGYAAYVRHDTVATQSSGTESVTSDRIGSEASHTQVQGAGVVSRVLPDDDNGSRHQRFILRLESGQTLLVAHNIDLAPRIDDLKEGDTVEYNGEYDWNPKGGVVHWTHRDPSGQHVAGWLKHDGRVFQ